MAEMAKIDELKQNAEAAAKAYEDALAEGKKNAITEVKALIKQYGIKEREVRSAFPKAPRKRKPKATT